MDAPWPGPRLALCLNFEASAGAGHKILGWPLAWPWLALGLALAGPWPGPWLALGLALGWPLAWPWLALGLALAGLVQTGSGSNQFQFRPVPVQTGSGSDRFGSSGSGSIFSHPESYISEQAFKACARSVSEEQ